MADFPPFAFTTQESWYGELSFKAAEDGSALSLAGRQFEMHITPATSGAQLVPPVLVLTMAEGRGLALKQGDPSTLVFRVPKTTANTFARQDYTADVLEVVGVDRYVFMPVRISYAEPSALRAFLSRFLGIAVTFSARQQPIYTPLAVPGREGRPGATILTSTVPPVPADGKDGDFFIEDRTASSQGRRMYGPKAGGLWPGVPWIIQVAAISDVPGLSGALSGIAEDLSDLSVALSGKAAIGSKDIGNADYAVAATDVEIAMRGMTASRTVTLPSAATYPKGQDLVILDADGTASPAAPLIVKAATGQTIGGRLTIDILDPFDSLRLRRAGPALWVIV